MEVKNRLLNYKDLVIMQNTDWFSFSLDSVLLPNFVTINKNIENIIDFCTGNAPIPLILSTKTNAKIYGVELQKEIYELAVKTIKLNNLENKIEIINDDIKNLSNYFETEFFDIITCNPPYFKYSENSNINKNKIKTIARHEVYIDLNIIFSIAKKILKNGGVIAMVHRPDRLIEIIETMKKNNIEPKKIQFIYPKENSECNAILIEGKKNGKPGLRILKPVYVHDEDGNYKEDIKKLFE